MLRTSVLLGWFSVAGLADAQTAGEPIRDSSGNASQRISRQVPNDAIRSFGDAVFEATGGGTENAIVGAVRQTGSGGNTFATGVTGYGSMESAGNQAFGLFGRCDLGIHLKSTIPGTCANELDAFNFSGPPSTMLPPDLSFGSRESNAISLQLVAYGDFDSTIALNLAGGGGAKRFYVGEYIHPQSVIYSALLIDATPSSSAKFGAIVKSSASNVALHLQTVGQPIPANAVLEYVDGAGLTKLVVDQAGDLTMSGTLSAKSIVDLRMPLSVAQGGTSSKSAPEARAALEAARNGSNSDITSLSAIRAIDFQKGGRLRLAEYTVGSLPTCNAAFKNALVAVTDASAPAYNAPLMGGGHTDIPAFCDGAVWTAH
jgi:hypothetical protein